MNLGSGKFLVPAFFSSIIFITASYIVWCKSCLISLSGYLGSIVGSIISVGVTLSILLFLYSYILSLSHEPMSQARPSYLSYIKMGMGYVTKYILLPVFLFAYGIGVRYFLPDICSQYVGINRMYSSS